MTRSTRGASMRATRPTPGILNGDRGARPCSAPTTPAETSRRHPMHGLDDERAVQRMPQGPGAGKAMRHRRIRREPGVPDHVEIVTDDPTPVKAQVEVDALVLVVDLHKSLEARARVERVLRPGARLDGVKSTEREPHRADRHLGADVEVSAVSPRGPEGRLDVRPVVEA